MGNDERGIDLIFDDAVEQIVSPSVHVGLPGADGQSLVHHGPQRKLVEQAAVDPRDRQGTCRSADIHHLPQYMRTVSFQHHERCLSHLARPDSGRAKPQKRPAEFSAGPQAQRAHGCYDHALPAFI